MYTYFERKVPQKREHLILFKSRGNNLKINSANQKISVKVYSNITLIWCSAARCDGKTMGQDNDNRNYDNGLFYFSCSVLLHTISPHTTTHNTA